MTTPKSLLELRTLQKRIDAIRLKLGISPPERVIFMALRDGVDDEMVVVQADGFGGATTMIVEGNYPVDFYAKFEKVYRSEEVATTAAEKLAFNEA
jgi:hypothetical protein